LLLARLPKIIYIKYMTDDTVLKKVGEIIIANNQVLLTAIDKKLQTLEQRLENKIKESQQDTIEVLSDLIHTGYDLHENRIKRVEDELHLPPLKQ
jgi:hypothetical protein